MIASLRSNYSWVASWRWNWSWCPYVNCPSPSAAATNHNHDDWAFLERAPCLSCWHSEWTTFPLSPCCSAGMWQRFATGCLFDFLEWLAASAARSWSQGPCADSIAIVVLCRFIAWLRICRSTMPLRPSSNSSRPSRWTCFSSSACCFEKFELCSGFTVDLLPDSTTRWSSMAHSAARPHPCPFRRRSACSTAYFSVG